MATVRKEIATTGTAGSGLGRHPRHRRAAYAAGAGLRRRATRLEPGARHRTHRDDFANGVTVREPIVTVDDAAMRLVWSVEGLRHHPLQRLRPGRSRRRRHPRRLDRRTSCPTRWRRRSTRRCGRAPTPWRKRSAGSTRQGHDRLLDRPRPHPLSRDVPRPPRPLAPGRALEEGLWRLEVRNIRDAATDRHRTVDDTPAGGGAGDGAARRHRRGGPRRRRAAAPDWPVLYLSPRGAPFTQARARALAAGPGVTLLCGRFEGIDERVLDARARRGGEPRRLRDDRRRDRRYGLDRRHGSAYRRRPRERRLDGGGNPSPPGCWSFRTIRARPNGKVCGYPRFSSRGITDGSPPGDAPRRRG